MLFSLHDLSTVKQAPVRLFICCYDAETIMILKGFKGLSVCAYWKLNNIKLGRTAIELEWVKQLNAIPVLRVPVLWNGSCGCSCRLNCQKIIGIIFKDLF